MPHQLEGLEIGERRRIEPRTLITGILLAGLIAVRSSLGNAILIISVGAWVLAKIARFTVIKALRAINFNVVTEREGFPAAVLIRGAAPIEGLRAMRRRRPGRPLPELANGPAKLCRAFQIDRSFDGHDLCGRSSRICLERRPPVPEAAVVTGPRVGLEPAGYGTHSMRRTKASLIYRRTKNLRAVQLLLGHSKIDYVPCPTMSR